MAADGEAVGKRGGKERYKNNRRKGGAEGDQIKRNVKRQSLGTDWEMSEVVVQPPHNLDNPCALVAGPQNNNNYK